MGQTVFCVIFQGGEEAAAASASAHRLGFQGANCPAEMPNPPHERLRFLPLGLGVPGTVTLFTPAPSTPQTRVPSKECTPVTRLQQPSWTCTWRQKLPRRVCFMEQQITLVLPAGGICCLRLMVRNSKNNSSNNNSTAATITIITVYCKTWEDVLNILKALLQVRGASSWTFRFSRFTPKGSVGVQGSLERARCAWQTVHNPH